MSQLNLSDGKEASQEEEKSSKGDMFKDKPIQPIAQVSARGDVKEESYLEYIPCLFLPFDDGARKLIIYFHGNAEDIGLAYDFLY